jgi:hypothetical protein
MNLKEFSLEEIELHASLIDEGIACLLHTILFVRAPGKFRPEDCFCKNLAPLVYVQTTEYYSVISFYSISPLLSQTGKVWLRGSRFSGYVGDRALETHFK